MRNALRVLKRDYLRLLKAPAALVVVLVLIILPSLYTWFNVVGFWDPYNNTGNIRVCVVNQDEGAHMDLGDMDLQLGNQVVDQLKENDQLGWDFVDYDTAMEEVKSGHAYAAFIIPKDFSYDVTTFVTGDFTQPKLEYYVNEKAGGVSTKITDTGANTLDETINSTFVSTISGVVADTLNTGITDAQEDIGEAQTSVSDQLTKAAAALVNARTTVTELSDSAGKMSGKAAEAKKELQSAKGDIDTLSKQLKEASDLLTETQEALGPFVTQTNTTLDKSSVLASKAAASANSAVSGINSSISSAAESVESVAQVTDDSAETLGAIADSLEELSKIDGLPEEAVEQLNTSVADLRNEQNALTQTATDLRATYKALNQASSDIASASDSFNSAFQSTISAGDSYRNSFMNETYPALISGTTQLANTLRDLSTSVSNQQLLIDQTCAELDQLISVINTTSNALGQTDGLLSGFQGDVDTVNTDLTALATSGALAELMGEDGIDADKIADFMASPTELETKQLYSVNAYGSAMAPLFMNMSLWIGVFMLLVILRQEVDAEGFESLTSRQRYLGKWLFLAPLVCAQAAVCCAGNLFLGVQTASVPLFFITAMFASLTYLSIQFALATLLQHVGKGLCIILIFVQIPGATGLYPIEMTPDFFQWVYPLFPFTYGINALRETIAGFYGLQWAGAMGVLLVFLLVFFIVGFLLRPYLINMNRMVGKAIANSDILNGEESELPARRYRITKVFRLVTSRDEYRFELAVKAKKFMRIYPRLRVGALFFAFGVPLIVTPIFTLLGFEKVITLTMWLIVLVMVITFLIGVEFIRDRMEHDMALDSLSDDELAELFQKNKSVADPSLADTQPIPVVGGDAK